MNKIERIQSLVKQLNYHSNLYYTQDQPKISDKEYDLLYQELETLELETTYILSSSPTQKVQGDILPFLTEVQHTEPMLSADKSKDINDVIKFMGNQECILSWKLDGCFSGNMKVSMADGTTKKIKHIKIGEEVLSFNQNTLEISKNKVTNIFNNGRKLMNEWRRVGIYNCKSNNRNSVHVTKNHKFLTPEGWKEVSNINEGDYVYTYDYNLSDSQQSFLIGMCLGDGCAIKRTLKNDGVEFRYSKVNKYPYNTLMDKFKTLFADKLGTERNTISGYNSEINTLFINTLKNLPIEMNNYKNILRTGYTFTEEIINLLTPLSLAIYYIDDGSKDSCQDDGYENTKNIKVRCRLSTYRHNIEEVERLSKYLKEKYDITNNIRFDKELKTEGSGCVIDILTDGTEKFFDLIAPYIPKEIRPYKLGMKDKWQNASEIAWWNDIGDNGLTINEVKENKQLTVSQGKNKLAKHLTAYDIEVENNHSYIIEGFAVHNCTIVLRYDKGNLIKAITRGGGTSGEDVTHTVKTFANIPLTIDYKGYLEIRGEGLVPFKDFERINNELIIKSEKTYASPRNLAAGSVRQLDATITKDRNLIFIAFGVVKCDKEFKRKDVQLTFLQELGFDVVEWVSVIKDCFKAQVEYFKNKIQYLDYLTDGLIIEFNDIAYGKAQGSTNHHSKAQYAMKWADDNCETVFKGVELNTTRTGMTSITGLFDEVDIAGVKVSRASLHNVDIFESLQLGIGDTITVYRANCVIPQIEDNLTRSNTYKIDMHCPSCGSNLIIKQPKEARFLFCENEDCPSRMVDKFVHFCNKDAMNIENLSEATLEKFINKGFIKTFSDIYKLEQYKSQITQMDGFGIKSYNKLIEAIEKSKNINMCNFIYALGIDQVGQGGSKLLAKKFKTIEGFINAKNSELLNIDGIGDIITESICQYRLEHLNIILDLLKFVTIIKPEEIKSTNINKDLTGKTFVVTGSVTTYRNRNELEDLIISLNGKLASTVSKNTNYLINNDITSTSGKNQKANELGVPIISEVEFNQMIEREV